MPDDNIAEYDRLYAQRHYDVASVYDHIVRIRQRYFADVSGRLLDHGFGNGVNALYFQREGFEVHGVETSAAALDLLRANAAGSAIAPSRFHLIEPEGGRWPFVDGFFDAAVSNQVLYFIPSRDGVRAACAELARVMRRGGKVACTVMAEDNYFFTEYGERPLPDSGPVKVKITGRIERDYLLYRLENEAELRGLFEEAGFIVDDLGYFDYRLLDVKKAKHYIVLARKA